MYVPAEGPKLARLAVVGEKPGREEVAQNGPFKGPTGKELRLVIRKLGILPEQVYLTNAVKEVNNYQNPTRDEIIAEQPALLKELSELPLLNCIVALGGSALASLSNFHYDRILSRRGSILVSCIGKKLVPAIHPSYYLHTGDFKMRNLLRFDIGRALEQSYTAKISLPERTYKIAETIEDVRKIRTNFSGASHISFDIETRGPYISCIGFAKRPDVAYCIPLVHGTMKPYWNLYDEMEAWDTIQFILAQKQACYVTQNGQFDTHVLWRHGILTPYMANGFDTCYAQRMRAPGLPAKLEYICSIHTLEPFYKDESGKWDEAPASDEQFWAYNCKDATVTLDAKYSLVKEMQRYKLYDHYMSESQALWDVTAQCRRVGIRVDRSKLQSVRETLTSEISQANARIKALIGWIPNTKSPIDMKRFMDENGMKYKLSFKTKRIVLDKSSVNHYLYNATGVGREVLGISLQINSRRTLLSGFTNIPLDKNDFYHPELKINATVTGRLASEGAAEGGPQIQNIPSYIRKLFLPDTDAEEFTSCDLKQAEQTLVAYLAQDQLFIEAFEKGIDVHRVSACVLFRNWKSHSLPPPEMLASIKEVCDDCAPRTSKCNHSERYIAKQSRHAFNYKMGIQRYCTERSKEGLFVDKRVAQEYKELLVSDAVKKWHERVATNLEHSAWLENPLGKRREFYGMIDEDMIREALSWLCQSTVGQITNRAMILLHEKFSHQTAPRPRIVTQTHDSILVSNLPEQRQYVIDAMQEAFYRPMVIHGNKLIIPLEISAGPNWGELHELAS